MDRVKLLIDQHYPARKKRIKKPNATSVDKTSKSREMRVVDAVSAGSLPGFDAEGFEVWLTDRITALQKERENAHQCMIYPLAERCKNYAAAYEGAKLELRRRMGRPSERQPEEKAVNEPQARQKTPDESSLCNLLKT